MSTALFPSPPSTHLPSLFSPHSNSKLQLVQKPFLSLRPPERQTLFWVLAENGSGAAAAIVEEDKVVNGDEKVPEKEEDRKEEPLGSNGSVKVAAAGAPAPETETEVVATFQDPRWVRGTWDLTHFQTDGKTNWDAVIDAGE